MRACVEHVAGGAICGALVGGTIAALGWVIRQRNNIVIDLNVPATHLMSRYRPLAECLLTFKAVCEHSSVTRALYIQIVKDCEFIAQHDTATGSAQIIVQKRILQAVACAKRLASEAFKYRDVAAHDCRAQIDTLREHLGNIQKNMMMV